MIVVLLVVQETNKVLKVKKKNTCAERLNSTGKLAVKECSVALLSCVADMSNTFRLIICVVVSSNQNAL